MREMWKFECGEISAHGNQSEKQKYQLSCDVECSMIILDEPVGNAVCSQGQYHHGDTEYNALIGGQHQILLESIDYVCLISPVLILRALVLPNHHIRLYLSPLHKIQLCLFFHLHTTLFLHLLNH